MTGKRHLLRKMWDFLSKSRCPNCDKSGGRKTDRIVIDSSDHIETKMQLESHYDSKGKGTGSTHRRVQVTMRTEIYEQGYRCDYCGYEWKKIKETTFQP
jgi:hypothetical protein